MSAAAAIKRVADAGYRSGRADERSDLVSALLESAEGHGKEVRAFAAIFAAGLALSRHLSSDNMPSR